MKVGDLVRLAPDCDKACIISKALKHLGIVKEKHPTLPLVTVFWTRNWTTGEFEEDLEVIHESR